MPGPRSSIFSRRLVIASVVFGLLVLCYILLFGWLIFRSLSQQELDRALLDTRAEAKGLAERIAKSGEESAAELASDLYVIVTKDPAILRDIVSDMVKREAVEEVAIYDQSGTLVWRAAPNADSIKPPGPPELPSSTLQLPPSDPTQPRNGGRVEVREAIGDLGTLRIGLSEDKLHERSAALRQDLLRQVVWILFVSFLVLVSVYVIFVQLLARARRLEQKAEEADQLATLGTLAAGLAHEIRNPLNSLNLNMQLLEEEMREAGPIPTGRRLLGITRQELGRLERLVTDFLLYAKPRPPELREVPAADLLARVRDVLAGELAARSLDLTIDDESGGVRVRADRGQMIQLLLNLVQNAILATEESGRPPRVALRARRRAGQVVLSVEDNGVGIPPEEQRRVFELFYSTRKGGTGLGLAVAERIAKAHGGAIELRSVPGVGTEVAVALPVVLAPLTGGTSDPRSA